MFKKNNLLSDLLAYSGYKSLHIFIKIAGFCTVNPEMKISHAKHFLK